MNISYLQIISLVDYGMGWETWCSNVFSHKCSSGVEIRLYSKVGEKHCTEMKEEIEKDKMRKKTTSIERSVMFHACRNCPFKIMTCFICSS